MTHMMTSCSITTNFIYIFIYTLSFCPLSYIICVPIIYSSIVYLSSFIYLSSSTYVSSVCLYIHPSIYLSSYHLSCIRMKIDVEVFLKYILSSSLAISSSNSYVASFFVYRNSTLQDSIIPQEISLLKSLLNS